MQINLLNMEKFRALIKGHVVDQTLTFAILSSSHMPCAAPGFGRWCLKAWRGRRPHRVPCDKGRRTSHQICRVSVRPGGTWLGLSIAFCSLDVLDAECFL